MVGGGRGERRMTTPSVVGHGAQRALARAGARERGLRVALGASSGSRGERWSVRVRRGLARAAGRSPPQGRQGGMATGALLPGRR